MTITNYGYCCTCTPQSSVSEAFNSSAWIVVGTIVDHQAVLEIDTSQYRRLIDQGIHQTQAVRVTSGGFSEYTFVLSEPAYKGHTVSDTLLIRTELTSGACGYSFQIGERYIVYGNNATGEPRAITPKFSFFWTSMCTRTDGYSEKERKKLIKIATRSSKKSRYHPSTPFETLQFRDFNVTVRTPYQMTHVNQQNAEFLKSHILQEMETYGFTVSSSPDLFVDISILVKLQAQFSRGSAFGMPIHQVGTLTVRLMEADQNLVLWEGSKTIPLWSMKERKAKQRVEQVVAKIFKDFDPDLLGTRNQPKSEVVQ
jgi:hypothetical protein